MTAPIKASILSVEVHAIDTIDLQAFDEARDDFDRLIQGDPAIDHFCSMTSWIIPAHHALMPPRDPLIYRSDAGYVALARGYAPRVGYYLEPLESMWQFACPFATAERTLVDQFATALRRDQHEWALALLGGIPRDGWLFQSLIQRLGPRYRLALANETVRHVADLSDGVEAQLSRRSRNFRRALERASRDADRAGVGFDYRCEFPDEGAADQVYSRIQAVERRSWKGIGDCGIKSGAMHTFYQLMLRRLGPAGQLRVLFATCDGVDVAYVFGGVVGSTYRGLQIAFDDHYRRLSLGNLCQLEQMRRLTSEPVRWYDLGSAMDYKARWADLQQRTVTLGVVAR